MVPQSRCSNQHAPAVAYQILQACLGFHYGLLLFRAQARPQTYRAGIYELSGQISRSRPSSRFSTFLFSSLCRLELQLVIEAYVSLSRCLNSTISQFGD